MSKSRATCSVDVFNPSSEEEFRNVIYPKRKPALLKGVNIGSCLRKWNAEYLSKAVGSKDVKIHVSESEKMDFLKKNFLYKYGNSVGQFELSGSALSECGPLGGGVSFLSAGFFSVPSFVKKPVLALQWTKNAKDEVYNFYKKATGSAPPDRGLEFKIGYVLKSSCYKVCELHFTQDCFEVDLKSKLMKNLNKKKLVESSVPTIYYLGLNNKSPVLLEERIYDFTAERSLDTFDLKPNRATQTYQFYFKTLDTKATQTDFEKINYEDRSTIVRESQISSGSFYESNLL